MNTRRQLRHRLRMMEKPEKAESVPYPLEAGKPETWNVFGEIKRYNPQTGKYDLPA